MESEHYDHERYVGRRGLEGMYPEAEGLSLGNDPIFIPPPPDDFLRDPEAIENGTATLLDDGLCQLVIEASSERIATDDPELEETEIAAWIALGSGGKISEEMAEWYEAHFGRPIQHVPPPTMQEVEETAHRLAEMLLNEKIGGVPTSEEWHGRLKAWRSLKSRLDHCSNSRSPGKRRKLTRNRRKPTCIRCKISGLEKPITNHRRITMQRRIKQR